MTATRQPVKVKINFKRCDRLSFGYWTVVGLLLTYTVKKKKNITSLLLVITIMKNQLKQNSS